MRDNFKLLFYTMLIGLLGMGCKNDTVHPILITPTVGEVQSISVPSVTFQAEENYANVGLSGTPFLSFNNIPDNTAQLLVMLEGLNRTKNSKILWIAAISGNTNQIAAQGFTTQTLTNDRSINNIIAFSRPLGYNSSTIEVFALNRTLVLEEIEKLRTMTRASWKVYCADPANNLSLLGTTIARDIKKAIEETIKIATRKIRSAERAITRAEDTKNKLEKKFMEGSVAANAVRAARNRLSALQNELINLQDELTLLQNKLIELQGE